MAERNRLGNDCRPTPAGQGVGSTLQQLVADLAGVEFSNPYSRPARASHIVVDDGNIRVYRRCDEVEVNKTFSAGGRNAAGAFPKYEVTLTRVTGNPESL